LIAIGVDRDGLNGGSLYQPSADIEDGYVANEEHSDPTWIAMTKA
jgi:hypothetical protein